MLYGFPFSFPARLIRSVEIDVVQQRLASKIAALRNGKAAVPRPAPGTLLRRSAARPVEMLSLIRVAVTAAQPFRGAYVPVETRLWGVAAKDQGADQML